MRTTTSSSLRAWVDDALCAQTDPEIFFPAKGTATKAAVRICGTCLVRPQCLTEALAGEPSWGLWGGMTPQQRARKRVGRPAPKHPLDASAA